MQIKTIFLFFLFQVPGTFDIDYIMLRTLNPIQTRKYIHVQQVSIYVSQFFRTVLRTILCTYVYKHITYHVDVLCLRILVLVYSIL